MDNYLKFKKNIFGIIILFLLLMNTVYAVSLNDGQYRSYSFNKLANYKYTVRLNVTSGDCDLYGHHSGYPTQSNYHRKSDNPSGQNESFTFDSTKDTKYFLRVYAYNGSCSFNPPTFSKTYNGSTTNNPPTLTSKSISKSSFNSGTSVTFSSTWNDPENKYIVDVQVRYRKQGTSSWSTNTMSYISGTTFRKTKTITGSAGTYEYQFRASDADTANGTRTNTTSWKTGGTFTINEDVIDPQLPTLSLKDVNPTIGKKGDTFNFEVTLSKALPTGYEVYMNFNTTNNSGWLSESDAGGHIKMSCSGTICRASKTLTQAGDRKVRVGIFKNNTLQGSYSNEKSFKVNETTTTGLPTTILSPVKGAFTVASSSSTKWSFNQHKTDKHKPNKGIGGSDDTYAWDINLNYPSDNTDKGKPVYAVADGFVTIQYADRLNGSKGSFGQLLIEHNNGGVKWWSGYLHMRNIEVSPSTASHKVWVTKNTILGYISDKGANNDHLHFAVYKGENKQYKLKSFNVAFSERSTVVIPPSGTTTKGIDVSHFNGQVNWNNVASGGVKFAFIKSSEGYADSTFPESKAYDNQFVNNMNGAISNNILVGAYHLVRPEFNKGTEEAKIEARYFISKIESFYKNNSLLPPVIDLESTSSYYSRSSLTDWVLSFAQEVEDTLGVKPILYMNENYIRNKVDSSRLSSYLLWVAKYSNSSPYIGSWSKYNYWQYTDTGTVSGVNGSVDINVFNGSLSQLRNQLTNSTSITLPTLSLKDVNPTIGKKGDTFNFEATLSKALPAGYEVYMNFNTINNSGWLSESDACGHIKMSCSGTKCTSSKTLTQAGDRKVRVGIFKNNALQGSYSSEKSFKVNETIPTTGEDPILAISKDIDAQTGSRYLSIENKVIIELNVKNAQIIKVDFDEDGITDVTKTITADGTYKLSYKFDRNKYISDESDYWAKQFTLKAIAINEEGKESSAITSTFTVYEYNEWLNTKKPNILSINPNPLKAKSGFQNIYLNGTNFYNGSVVYIDYGSGWKYQNTTKSNGKLLVNIQTTKEASGIWKFKVLNTKNESNIFNVQIEEDKNYQLDKQIEEKEIDNLNQAFNTYIKETMTNVDSTLRASDNRLNGYKNNEQEIKLAHSKYISHAIIKIRYAGYDNSTFANYPALVRLEYVKKYNLSSDEFKFPIFEWITVNNKDYLEAILLKAKLYVKGNPILMGICGHEVSGVCISSKINKIITKESVKDITKVLKKQYSSLSAEKVAIATKEGVAQASREILNDYKDTPEDLTNALTGVFSFTVKLIKNPSDTIDGAIDTLDGAKETVKMLSSEIGDIAKNIPKLVENMTPRYKVYYTAYLTTHLAHEFAPTSKLKLLKLTKLDKFKRPLWLSKSNLLKVAIKQGYPIKLSIIKYFDKKDWEVFEEIYTKLYKKDKLIKEEHILLSLISNNNQKEFKKYLLRIWRGNRFNKLREKFFDANEVYIDTGKTIKNGKGIEVKKYFRLDSYNTKRNPKGIFSRKDTQLSDITEQTAKKYLKELKDKYPAGAIIADVKSSRKYDPPLNGKKLEGQLYLEVPVQNKAVSKEILDYANDKEIIIRDINGKEYN